MVNDMTIVFGFLIFFTLLGIIAPFLNDSFADLNVPSNNPDSVFEDFEEPDLTSGWDIFLSAITMSFWSFGLPTWINSILLPLRIKCQLNDEIYPGNN